MEAMIDKQPIRELPGGGRMPVLGLGVWQIPDGHETEQAVEWALEAGYRHIDTASLYHNERGVGSALKRSGLPREQLFVTTKLMPARLNVARELEASLERLGLDYVDLYLIHWPLPLVTTRQWRALESLQEAGLARSIGVSNFGLRRLRALVAHAAREPAVDQVQLSPLHYRRRLVDYCHEHEIVPVAYSPLERGRAFENPTITAIADRLGRTAAQVMLRWAVQHGAVVIPKSSRQEHIRSNAQIFDFELNADSMRALDDLDQTGGSGRARP
jgi:2,5-diketo-D-gluconate reductase A